MPSGPVALLGSRDERAESTSYSDNLMLSSFGCGSGRELGFGRGILLDLIERRFEELIEKIYFVDVRGC